MASDYENIFYGLDDFSENWQYNPSPSTSNLGGASSSHQQHPQLMSSEQAQQSIYPGDQFSDADISQMMQDYQPYHSDVANASCYNPTQNQVPTLPRLSDSNSRSIEEGVYGQPQKKTKTFPIKVAPNVEYSPSTRKLSGRSLREEKRKEIASALDNAGWFNTASSEARCAIVNRLRPLWGFPETPLGFLHATAQVVGSITPQHAAFLLDPQQQRNFALMKHIAYETRPRLNPRQEIPAQQIKNYLMSSINIPESRANDYILAALKYEGMAKKPLPEVVQHIIKKIRWPRQFEEQQVEIYKSLQKRP